MSSSKKCKRFLAESNRGKRLEELRLEELPGFGAVAVKRLKEYKYNIQNVLAKFLRYNREETEFCNWLISEGGLNSKNQKECYDALKEFCDQRL